MSAIRCPVCTGGCCRDTETGYRTVHMGAECYLHDCDFCHDGTVPERVWDATQERAAIVAWLRVEPQSRMLTVEETAACIERGEHRVKEEVRP